MWKLAAVMYLLVAPVLAGVAVLVALAAPQLGYATLDGVTLLGLGGLAAGVPLSFVAAAMVYRKPRNAA